MSQALNVDTINTDSSQDNIPEWDSLGYLSVLFILEEKFNLKVTSENINNFGSIENIVQEIEKKL